MVQKYSRTERLLEQYTKKVDPIIKEILDLSVVKRYRELVEYQISTGGKRLRRMNTSITCYSNSLMYIKLFLLEQE